jgi:hypothetical protein
MGVVHVSEVEVKKVATSYLQQQRAQHFRQHTGDAELVVPLRVKPEMREMLLRHPRFVAMDVVDVYALARLYIKKRLPIPDKETAVAILLGCIGYGQPLPTVGGAATLHLTAGRKFRS